MLNVPLVFDHPLSLIPNDELKLGLIYGFGLATAMIRVGCSAGLRIGWFASVVAVTFVLLWHHDPASSADRIFVISTLMLACIFASHFHVRWQDQDVPERRTRARQISIAGLMLLTTVVAVLFAWVESTSLVDRGWFYWAGLLMFSIGFAFCFTLWQSSPGTHSFVLFAVATLAAVGLAAADARWVQPDRLTWPDAIPRYAAMLYGMIAPKILLAWAVRATDADRFDNHRVLSKITNHSRADDVNGRTV